MVVGRGESGMCMVEYLFLLQNKKGSNVEVLVQKIKELIREPALVNR